MNINSDQVNQVLNKLSYPISKDSLVQQARQNGLPDQVCSMLDKLPDKTFNSADDIKNAMSSAGGIGGKIGGMFK
jgi:hypothetical protein